MDYVDAIEAMKIAGEQLYALDADEMAPIDAIDAIAEIDKLVAKAREARDLLATRVVNTLEQPAVLRGNVWFVTDDYVDRWDHDAVINRITAAVAIDENGEIDQEARKVATAIAGIMRDLYLSPSVTAKKAQAEKYGVSGARSRENRGRKLVKKQVEEPQSHD